MNMTEQANVTTELDSSDTTSVENNSTEVQSAMTDNTNAEAIEAVENAVENTVAEDDAVAEKAEEIIEEAVEQARQSNPRVISGKVVSNKMNKTCTVLVSRRVKHKKYNKVITLSSKMHVHDELNQTNIGDYITAIECRPLSKTKTWNLMRIDSKVANAISKK